MSTESLLLQGHNTISTYWRDVCHHYPPGFIEATVSSAVLTIGFVFPATIYLILDELQPHFLQKRKIQQPERQPTGKRVSHCILHSLFNYSFTIIGMFAFHWLYDWNYSIYRMEEDLPALSTVVSNFVYAILFREVIFYYIHRLLHHRYFYSRIHSKHHEFTTPIAFAAIYCHPLEMLLQNALPIGLPLAICRGHFLCQVVFALYAVWDSTAAHSGYDFGRLPIPEVHDKHHEHPFMHFGVTGFMDWVHSTNKKPSVTRHC